MNPPSSEEDRILWSTALATLSAEAGDENVARFALGRLLDGELDLEQEDDTERVISQRELDLARSYLKG